MVVLSVLIHHCIVQNRVFIGLVLLVTDRLEFVTLICQVSQQSEKLGWSECLSEVPGFEVYATAVTKPDTDRIWVVSTCCHN